MILDGSSDMSDVRLQTWKKCVHTGSQLDRNAAYRYSEIMKPLKSTLILLIALSAFSVTSVRADQPHMQRAIQHLRAARAELERAEHNKGGWRARAISS